jgi:hypothetical protein
MGSPSNPMLTVEVSPSAYAHLTKLELRALCDRLLTDNQGAVKTCVRFLEAETFGLWHGRARAMMARRLKHCRLSAWLMFASSDLAEPLPASTAVVLPTINGPQVGLRPMDKRR